MTFNYEPYYGFKGQTEEILSHKVESNGVEFSESKILGSMGLHNQQPLSEVISTNITQRLDQTDKCIDLLGQKIQPIYRTYEFGAQKVLDAGIAEPIRTVNLMESDLRARLHDIERRINEINSRLNQMISSIDNL